MHICLSSWAWDVERSSSHFCRAGKLFEGVVKSPHSTAGAHTWILLLETILGWTEKLYWLMEMLAIVVGDVVQALLCAAGPH